MKKSDAQMLKSQEYQILYLINYCLHYFTKSLVYQNFSFFLEDNT